MRIKSGWFGIAVICLGMGLAACGGQDAEAPDDTAAVVDEAADDAAADDATTDDAEAAAPEEAMPAEAEPVAPPIASFVATDYAFEGPADLPAGLTEIRLANKGEEIHHLQFALLDEGKTAEDLGAAMGENPEAVPDFVTLLGGPNGAMPGETVNAYVDLVPGDYVLMCTVPSPDGVVHAEKGMMSTLSVAAPEGEGEAAAAAPEADLTVTGSDFAFDAPETIAAGAHTINFVNAGQQDHEIVVVKLDEGATIEDFAAAFGPDAPPGPPPGRTVSGTVGITPGSNQSFDTSFESGSYALICFFPDPASGAPHFALGMTHPFTVE
ncbi:MAG: hypothetical protein H6648_04685 [Caldilineae bacterium]|nr:hypothetical protein [Caldilineae bacterium]